MKSIKLILLLIIVLFAIIIIYNAVFPYSSPGWMGFIENTTSDEKIKTLWDWLDLLIVPISIGIVGWIYKDYENQKEESRQKENNYTDLFNNYLKNISELILKEGLLESNEYAMNLARSLTIVALENLDGERKGQILQFLKESNVLQNINLLGANFRNCDLEGIVLKNQIFKGIDFSHSNLTNSFLDGTEFIACNLSSANFSYSSLLNVNFEYSILKNSIIRNTDLKSVNFFGVELGNADLRDSLISDDQFKQISKFNKGIKITCLKK